MAAQGKQAGNTRIGICVRNEEPEGHAEDCVTYAIELMPEERKTEAMKKDWK